MRNPRRLCSTIALRIDRVADFLARPRPALGAAALWAAVVGFLPAATLAQTQVRTSAFDYHPDTGLLIREVIEPDDPALRLSTEYVHDVFGNRVQTTTVGNGVEPRTSSMTYDGAGRYPTSATNALGQTETRAHHPLHGAQTSQTGPNGLTTSWIHDGFGRRVQEWRADGTARLWTYYWYPIASWLTYYVEQAETGAPNQVDYFDRLQRNVIRDAQSFSGRGVRTKEDYYDEYGRLHVQIKPYEHGSPWPLQDAPAVAHIYDDTGRLVRKREVMRLGHSASWDRNPHAACAPPECLQTTINYGFDPGSRVTWVQMIDAKGQPSARYSDYAGRLVRVEDAHGGNMWYGYDALGNLTATTDQHGNRIDVVYDRRGRRIESRDPSLGRWTYEYNAFGELTRQTDAKGQVATLVYDRLGRLVRRNEADLTSHWAYDRYPEGADCGKGVGKLCETWAGRGYRRRLHYDGVGRTQSIWVFLNNDWQKADYRYDGASRLSGIRYPSGLEVAYDYNAANHLSRVRRADTGQTIFQRNFSATAPNALGHYRLQVGNWGNGFTEERAFDFHDRHRVVIHRDGGGTVHRYADYAYDAVHNLAAKTEAGAGSSFTENYAYDALNRLTQSSGPGLPTKQIQYDAVGNIVFKTGVGNYAYPAQGAGSVRPHAVAAINGSVLHGATGSTYAYDANGNLVSGGGRTIAWTSYNMPQRITLSAAGITRYQEFVHDTERRRVREADASSTKWIVNPTAGLAPFYEIKVEATKTERLHFVDFDGAAVAVIKRTQPVSGAASESVEYLHTDAQGSTVLTSDQAGGVTEVSGYDAWGARRNAGTGADCNRPPFQCEAVRTDRGYTGHEQLAGVGLIHMNGRVYDPILGRMASADPFVPSAENMQAYNRYAYVLNNPLRYTDPDGFKPFWKKKWFKAVAAIAVVALTQQYYLTSAMNLTTTGWVSAEAAVSYQAVASTSAKMIAGAAGGFTGGLIASGGNAKAALAGAATGGAFGIASSFGATSLSAERLAAHAVVGCGSGVLQGGGCGRGALSAVVGKAVTGTVDDHYHGSYKEQLNFAATVTGGGLASVAGGGKFENGAATAAYGYLFNQALSRYQDARLRMADRNAGIPAESGRTAATEEVWREVRPVAAETFDRMGRSAIIVGAGLYQFGGPVRAAGIPISLVGVGLSLTSDILEPKPIRFGTDYFIDKWASRIPGGGPAATAAAQAVKDAKNTTLLGDR